MKSSRPLKALWSTRWEQENPTLQIWWQFQGRQQLFTLTKRQGRDAGEQRAPRCEIWRLKLIYAFFLDIICNSVFQNSSWMSKEERLQTSLTAFWKVMRLMSSESNIAKRAAPPRWAACNGFHISPLSMNYFLHFKQKNGVGFPAH